MPEERMFQSKKIAMRYQTHCNRNCSLLIKLRFVNPGGFPWRFQGAGDWPKPASIKGAKGAAPSVARR